MSIKQTYEQLANGAALIKNSQILIRDGVKRELEHLEEQKRRAEEWEVSGPLSAHNNSFRDMRLGRIVFYGNHPLLQGSQK